MVDTIFDLYIIIFILHYLGNILFFEEILDDIMVNVT